MRPEIKTIGNRPIIWRR